MKKIELLQDLTEAIRIEREGDPLWNKFPNSPNLVEFLSIMGEIGQEIYQRIHPSFYRKKRSEVFMNFWKFRNQNNMIFLIRLWLFNFTKNIKFTEGDLEINDNDQTYIPDLLWNMTNLRTLEIIGSNLPFLPGKISYLKKLVKLNLHDNNLTELAEAIGILKHLQTLNLGGNNLTVLPESIGNLSNLEILRISGNKLTHLPNSIGNLTKLKDLKFFSNDLTRLPDSIVNLKNLKVIHFRYNPNLVLTEAQREWLEALKQNNAFISYADDSFYSPVS